MWNFFTSFSKTPPSPLNIDHISQLPDHILEYILSKLTLRDAAQTTVLSTRWMEIGIWSRSNLIFDSVNIFGTRKNSTQTIDDEHSCEEFRVRFVNAVNSILDSIEDSVPKKMQSFIIQFCLGVESHDDFNNWIRFAVRRRVRNLQVKLYCPEKEKVPYDIRLVSDLNLTGFHNLETMIFERCYPTTAFTVTGAFVSLNFLKFSCVNFKDYDIPLMFSCLKKLARLEFFACDLPNAVSLTPLVSLQRFYVSLSRGVKTIEVLNPKLAYVYCRCATQVQIISDGVEISNIDELSLGGHANSWEYIFTGLSYVTPRLTRLSIFSENDELPPTQTPHVVNFPHVTYLSITLMYPLEFSKMNRALGAFPRLEKLRIVHMQHVRHVNFWNYDKHVYERLEVIECRSFRAISSELLLLVYFLIHAPSLKRLIMDRDITPEALLRARKTLQPFVRDIEIIFQ